MKPTVPYTKADNSRVTYLEKKDTYKRACGYYPDSKTPKVFYLCSDEHDARARALKLDTLWKQRQAKGDTVWTDQTLQLAAAIAKGQQRAELPWQFVGGFGVDGVNAYQGLEDLANELQVDNLQNDVIPVVMAQPAFKSGKATIGGITLHKAIDQFAAYCRKNMVTPGTQTTSPYGVSFSGAVERLKDSHADYSLASIGYIQLEELTRYWTRRPNRKGTNKPISIDSVDAQVSALRRFIKWASKHCGYRKPEDWLDATMYKRKSLRTREEIAAKATRKQVKTYSVEELETVWRYCTKWERCLLVLSLNTAFGAAELSSLRMNELHLKAAKVERIRTKSGVYGEFQLWPETTELLKWAVERRKAISETTPTSFVLCRQSGETLVKQTKGGFNSDFAYKSWKDVIAKVQRDVPNFKYISWKHIRKTAANLIRQVSDGETAAVFLCHGETVESDELAEIYTDRDFAKMFAAQRKVHKLLAGMFKQPVWARGDDRGAEIVKLFKQGVKPMDIAKQLRASIATVYRQLESAA